jgi:hypothetical protein
MRENRPDWRTTIARRLAPYAKGVAAVLTAFAIAAQAPLTDGRITSGEWVAIFLSLVGAGSVIGVTNAPLKGKHEASE